MNPEKLHDALNLLDEELIAPVEQLRRRGIRWHHIGAFAACLAVVCVLGLYASGLFDRAETCDMAQELAMEVASEETEENQPVRAETDEQSVGADEEGVDQALNIPLPSAVLSIDRLENDRFVATVLQTGGTLAEGERVTVLLTEETTLALGDQQEASLSTDGQLLFEGASVVVFFVPGPQKGTVCAAVISFAE